MKRIVIAAGALLLGSSAIALADQPTAKSDFDKFGMTAAKLATGGVLAGAKAATLAKAGDPSPKFQLASAQVDEKFDKKPVELAWYDGKDHQGMGGPLEEVETTVANATDPATRNYPPCRGPGPGDDNCIQLYEPGVRAQLAASQSATGMGGPLEEVDKPVKPVGDGSIVQDGKPDAKPAVGGPVEARSGYPPCSATVTDSCIQLYEPGVTGAGN